jgi:hypothetical protein
VIEFVIFQLKKCGLLLLGCLFICTPVIAANSSNLWKDFTGNTNDHESNSKIQPMQFRVLTLELSKLHSELTAIGMTDSVTTSGSKRPGEPVKVLALPMPEGGFAEFTLSDSRTLPSELIKKYPKIRSFRGSDGKGGRLRLDISPQGMQAVVFDSKGTWLVRPAGKEGGNYAKDKGEWYWSFRENALPSSKQIFIEKLSPNKSMSLMSDAAEKEIKSKSPGGNMSYDYRIAIAATSDYVEKFGGTVESGLAEITALINRINEIFETDMGIHLTLVADNDKIIYANKEADPFRKFKVKNVEGEVDYGPMLDFHVTNLVEKLGDNNYDIGHLVTTDLNEDSEGVAVEGTCQRYLKGRGMSSVNNPVGDHLYVNMIAHELAHQFGAEHTFNSFYGQNDGASVDYVVEPGSGSTIMAYAGMGLSSEILQNKSDRYFHAKRPAIHARTIPYISNPSKYAFCLERTGN